MKGQLEMLAELDALLEVKLEDIPKGVAFLHEMNNKCMSAV